MIVSEAVAAMRLTLSGVGAALSALNGVQLAFLIPLVGGFVYSLVQFLTSLRNFLMELVVNSPYDTFAQQFDPIFQSDLYRLVSYCCSFKTLGVVFNFYFFIFMTFVVLTGATIALWAGAKFMPTITRYIYGQARQVTGG